MRGLLTCAVEDTGIEEKESVAERDECCGWVPDCVLVEE